ncbi:MAG: hypothetical protein M1822_007235 [Bathelium mastoideum]|nr:MAG: hypothetical protein M1822_007235 [Bathelium mastoideum]
MDLDLFAERFSSALPLTCLVYDNRGFGDSDTKEGQPRHEIIPAQQESDYSDAITYAQSRSDVDKNKIGIWGSSYSGGHVLWVGAADRRVKAVLCQVPCVDGWANFHRLVRSDFVPGLNQLFQDDRLARATGKPAGIIPVTDADANKLSALPTPETIEFFGVWEKKSNWKNEVTVKSYVCFQLHGHRPPALDPSSNVPRFRIEAFREYNPSANIHRISPTPLLMTVTENDTLTPTDISLAAYARALEPKRLHILPGGHFDAYAGTNFDRNTKAQTEFLREYLCT